MADEIVLPVPETLFAVYLVPTSRPPDDLEALAGRIFDALGEPLGELVRGMLTVALLELEVRPATELPAMPLEILTVMGASESSLALVREAERAVVVTAAYQPGWPPAHEWGAAALAGGIAARLDVPVLDVVVPRLRTAKQVLDALPTAQRPLAAVDWIQVVHSATPEGLWFTTKGLGRFGLPELATQGVPPQLAGPWTSVLNGVAQVLLRTYADALGLGEDRAAFVALPTEFEAAEEDIVRAHGGTPAGSCSPRTSSTGRSGSTGRASSRAGSPTPSSLRGPGRDPRRSDGDDPGPACGQVAQRRRWPFAESNRCTCAGLGAKCTVAPFCGTERPSVRATIGMLDSLLRRVP